MSAWFDPHPGNGSSPEVVRFDGASVVYSGPFHEEYIEGSYIDLFNTDAQDEEAGREACGDRARVSGILSLTHSKGILGRIRWTEHTYVDSVTSACAGKIDCVRDVQVSGVAIE